jgi:DNA helicase-2/ATP-dependent DNA helicase PcrA
LLLNPAQQKAVDTESEIVAVIACAGSGKTFTLIQRIYDLVTNRGVNPATIKPITFTRKAAGELRERLEKVGIRGVRADTFHSFCYNLINGYATRLGYRFPVNAYDEHLANSIIVDIMISYNLPYGKPVKNEKLRTQSVRQVRNWIEKIYETKPEEWIRIDEEYHHRLKAYNAVDYAMMIRETVRLLSKHPDIRSEIHNTYHHFMVDEFQDTDPTQLQLIELIDPKNLFIIGDFDQCVDGLTEVKTTNGKKPIHELNPGDEITSYRNGGICYQRVIKIKNSRWTEGIEIVTKSGNRLLMSENHKIWATMPVLNDSQHIVYLMYKKEFGFRVGTTNKCKSEKGRYDFGQRGRAEIADLLWIIDICPDRQTALKTELWYSLKYGIPTLVFNAKGRGLDEDNYREIFERFGKNGHDLLNDQGLRFDYPHWIAEGIISNGKNRYRINLLAHSESNTQVSFEWTGPQLDESLESEGIEYHVEPENRRRIRRWFVNHNDGEIYASQLAKFVGGYLRRRIAHGDSKPTLLTAAGLHCGMKVITYDNHFSRLDEIIEINKHVPGKFFDIEVDDSNNFYGNGILSHNSIYAWRGATPENIFKIVDQDDCELIHLNMNYRCNASIIEHSNKLIANNPNPIRVDAVPREDAEDGTCFARGTQSESWVQAALLTKDLLRKYKPNEIAILCRDNGREHYPVGCFGVARALKDLGIEYKRIIRDGTIWESWEVRNIIYTLNLILNPRDRASWAMAIDFPMKRTSQDQRAEIRRKATHERLTLLEASLEYNFTGNKWAEKIISLKEQWDSGAGQDTIEFFDLVVSEMNWINYFRPLTGRLFSIIIQRIKLQMKTLAESGYPTLQDFIEWWLSREAIEDNPNPNAVEVSTIHSYKGLEKRVVIIPGLDQNFPKLSKKNLNLDEEVRIFYVALTRAEEACYVLYSDEPSQFVKWAGFFDDTEEDEGMVDEFIQ